MPHLLDAALSVVRAVVLLENVLGLAVDESEVSIVLELVVALSVA